MRNARMLLLFIFPIIIVTACTPNTSLIDDPAIVVLKGATVIDGTGSNPRPDMVVIIKGGKIQEVTNSAKYRFADNVTVKDLQDKWIIPGFVDIHTHMPSGHEQSEYLSTILSFGITAIRNPAATPEKGTDLRDRLRSEALRGPRMLTAGVLIDGVNSARDWAAKVETEEQIRQEVERQISEGVDYIKLYVGLTPELVTAAITEAHGHGVKVIGHLGRTTWLEAAEAGIDGILHSWFAGLAHSIVPDSFRDEFKDFYMPNPNFDPSLFRRWRNVVDLNGPEMKRLADILVKRQIVVDPNLVLAEAICWGDDPQALKRLEPEYALASERESWINKPHAYSANWPKDALEEAKTTFPMFLDAVRILHEHGVVLAVGTDLRNPWMTPGVSFHREMQLLVDSGISNIDVLTIATRNGAQALDLYGETGTVEPGKRADLVVLSADPLRDIRNTRKIESVFIGGEELDPASLLQHH